jgi:hypothetical protein
MKFSQRKRISGMKRTSLLTALVVCIAAVSNCFPLCESRVQSSAFAPSLRTSSLSKRPHVRKQPLFMSSEIRDDQEILSPKTDNVTRDVSESEKSWLSKLMEESPLVKREALKPPPMMVEDSNLLFYDVFLLLNMSMSISFWVVHRMSFDYIGSAVSEGSLLCCLWIVAGLWHGAFLNSAVDGHYGSSSEKGGPRAAGMLGLQTSMTTSNLRILVALAMAVVEHRKVGDFVNEQLIPLEIVFGLTLMSIWRALHSSVVPRL